MLKNILELRGATALSKQQQININGGLGLSGGGTCGYIYYESYDAGDGTVDSFTFAKYGVSKQEAQSKAGANGGNWCCDNCATASWISQTDFQ